jgi:hypothetical protein
MAARHRGVRVRVITDVEQQKGQGSDAERIRQAGIALRYDLEDKYHMHHKVRSRRRRGIAMSRPARRGGGWGITGGMPDAQTSLFRVRAVCHSGRRPPPQWQLQLDEAGERAQ